MAGVKRFLTTFANPKAIKKARLEAGLTQSSAAALIGYTRRAWQSWEIGARKMRLQLLEAFKKLL